MLQFIVANDDDIERFVSKCFHYVGIQKWMYWISGGSFLKLSVPPDTYAAIE